MVTRQPVAAGEELLISYGAHDDALLLSQVLIKYCAGLMLESWLY